MTAMEAGTADPRKTPPVRDDVRAQIASEATFWGADPFEKPGADTLENLVNKTQDAAIFFDLVHEFTPLFAGARRIVEVGGGQGWASCLVKRRFPAASVALTDAVPEAIAGRGIWERVFACRLDAAHAAPAQALPFDDASVDLLFCFAAAHHFVDHDAALREVGRVLTPRGHCLWLYEPTAPRWLHRAAERRVNRKRVDVPEHVLKPGDVRAAAARQGLHCEVRYSTSIRHRGRGATLYFTVLGALPVLTRLLPCTAHFILTPAGAVSNRGG
ncbi:MAG: class I SAM-dependent methyltransferase [Gemmatimonadaceae bacterium]|nr:class I SAM-dependent methyltransferase [Gemmatimonadaceae bacterium]